MKKLFKTVPVLALMACICCLSTKVLAQRILGVRVGDHPGYTRIVIDVDQKPNFKVSTIKTKNQVRLFGTKLKCGSTIPKIHHKLINKLEFTAFQTGHGELKFHTTHPIAIKKAFDLPPSKTVSHFRYVIDLEKSSAPTVKKKPITPPPPKKKVVVIDPGHGGKDPGALGRGGIKEKDVTLSVAKTLKRVLDKTNRYKVVLTRNSDCYLKLPKRVDIARKAKADLFISLHADSHPRSDTRGLSVYTLSKVASDKEAEKLAIKENKADLIDSVDLNTESPDVANILIDLMKRETMNLSRKTANHFISRLRKRVLLLRNPIRSANFAVLRTADLPAVLIEMGYISNRQDEKLLTTSWHQAKLCEGIREGIDSYFAEHK